MDDKDLENEEKENETPAKANVEEEILGIIRSKRPASEIRDELENYHEGDIADVFPLLSPEERKQLYKILGTEWVSDIFTYLDDVENYIAELDASKAADIIETMDADDAIDVLDELEEEKKEEIIHLMEDESVKDIELIDSYDDDMIGSKMTTNFISISKNLSIKKAMKAVIDQAADNDNIQTIYAKNDDETFYGAIELVDLIRAREGSNLDDIITTQYPFVYDTETVEECLEDLKNYSEDSIPVLDKNKILIGVITSSDIVEVVDEELGDDYAKLAGLTEAEDISEPLFKSIRKRIPWLLILLGLGLIVASVISKFQSILPLQLIILYSFQSLILDMSGNTGTQSLGVTIRVLNEDNFGGKGKFRYVLKELRVAAVNGLLIGTLAFVFIGLYVTFLTSVCADNGFPSYYGFLISGTIGLSLLLAMMCAGLGGTLIPMTFKKIGIDPAVASGPLITTVNDLIAVCVYYGMSMFIFTVVLGLF